MLFNSAVQSTSPHNECKAPRAASANARMQVSARCLEHDDREPAPAAPGAGAAAQARGQGGAAVAAASRELGDQESRPERICANEVREELEREGEGGRDGENVQLAGGWFQCAGFAKLITLTRCQTLAGVIVICKQITEWRH